MIHPAPQPPRPTQGPAAALIGTVTTMSTVVNVLVDGFERLGPLSYYTGSTDPTVGDAVAVPFGKRTATGVVLGPGNPSKAEKDILSVHGPRSTPQDLEAATTTARTQLSPVTSMMRRLAPTSNKGSAPINAGPVTLAREWPFTYTIPDGIVFTLLLTPPLVSSAAVAAVEARRMSDLGQVLVLCPTKELVAQVRNEFSGGAERLDAQAPAGAWTGFRAGTVTVGIGARGSALYSADKLAGIIVVDEEHPAHIEMKTPRTHTRDAAVARAKAHRIPLTLISRRPTPSGIGAIQRVVPVNADEDWPTTTLYNLADPGVSTSDMPDELILQAEKLAAAGRKPVILVGATTYRTCKTCGLSFDTGSRCPSCGTTAIRVRGYDEERVAAVFGDTADTCTRTELATLRNAGLVILPDIHRSLTIPDLVPFSRTWDIILDACTAAGPGGQVAATHWGGGHPLLTYLMGNHDSMSAAKAMYAHAESLALPPFGRVAEIHFTKDAPNLAGIPGKIHGPVPAARGGGCDVLVRCAPHELRQLERIVQGWRRKKVKFTLHVS